jgi:hypothetical protein
LNTTPEKISGYEVHPAAAIFPLIEGDDFINLCESIRLHGVQHPAMVHAGQLLDGRNRMRACEKLNAEGWSGSCPVVEWKDDGRNVADWIWDTNAIRRHMSDDGLALASASIQPLIAKENEARKAAAQFNSETASKAAKARHTVRTESTEPQKRDHKAEDARSTVGQVAAKAKTSRHKAKQAIAVHKAIEDGELPADTAKAVLTGKKKLRDVAPKKPAAKPAKPAADAPAAGIQPQVVKAWEKLKAKFAITDHRDLRKFLAAIIRDEQKEYGEAK